MAPTTRVGLLLLLPTLLCLGGGWSLVRYANGLPVPDHARPRAVPGTVSDLVAVPCFRRGGRPTRTCFRTIVDYEDAGQVQQLPSRSVHHPALHARGDKVEVLVKPDGTAFIDREWEDDRKVAMRDYRKARDFPLLMGWLLAGCGAFAGLLSAGVTFWVDRSGTAETKVQ
jgi:hypothetical protein